MSEIHPETDEVVDDVSRTAQMRVANVESERAHRRAIADTISTLEDKAWKRGWLIGFVTGAAIILILRGIWLWIFY